MARKKKSPSPRSRNQAAGRAPKSAWRRFGTPALAAAVIALAAFLLYRTLSKYSMADILASMSAIPATRFALAITFAAASYLCLSGFDFLATRYVGHRLPYRNVLLASFCSLSLGHNIGFAALSSGTIRYRFYSRWGVSVGDIARIIAFCGVTVGLGLAILGGMALLLRSDLGGDMTDLSRGGVLALGVLCLALPATYVGLAATVRRPLRFRKWTLELPPVRLALAQCGIGALNFACVAACLYQVLAGIGEVSYFGVAAAYVIATVTALITHVPGGLGVIEAVVLYLLPEGRFIGALMAFRVIYYLIPLGIGGPLFGLTELWLRRRAAAAPA